MSQTTADDLLSSMGFTAVKPESTDNNVSQKTVDSSAPSRRRRLTIAIISSLVLATGFKLIGDYACDCAIDAWAARENAKYSVVSPEVLKFFETEKYEGDLTQESPAAPEADSVSVRN